LDDEQNSSSEKLVSRGYDPSIDYVLEQIIYTSKQWELWDSHTYIEQTARGRIKQRTQKRDLEKHQKQTQKKNMEVK